MLVRDADRGRKCSSLSITTDTAAGHSQATDQRPHAATHSRNMFASPLPPPLRGPSLVCTLYNIIIVALINARTGDPLQADGRGGGGGGHAPCHRGDIHPRLVLVHNVTTPGSALTLHVTCYMLHVTCYMLQDILRRSRGSGTVTKMTMMTMWRSPTMPHWAAAELH